MYCVHVAALQATCNP